VLRLNNCGKNPPLRQAANRWVQVVGEAKGLLKKWVENLNFRLLLIFISLITKLFSN
jgi:hypothetical protein